ncbi:uncharacterized protein LOC143283532 [Babylonia areolata]|uniref:uncharacterized protein LOC143283532 n=1 Tax=Babylonia areolata TaxID=304850 RepID=UPI003FD1898C
MLGARDGSSFVTITLVFFACDVLATTNGVSVNLTSPEVFNVHFYINTNVEVLEAGVRDVTSAQQHWLHHGIDMGLQACGDFHSAQYLARYPDLTQSFGAHNYRQAVMHYLSNGLKERRHGYLEGGYWGRWTVADKEHRLVVSASRRMGGAIDSLVWNHKEFINAWDHGRELQMAMNFLPNGECYNPTEAGGRYDFQKNSSHTHIQSVHVAGHRLTTKVLPAFWTEPDPQHTHRPGLGCSEGQTALNTAFTYPFPFSKTVTLACPAGVTHPCLHFQSSFTIGGDIPPYTILQMEAPTGYLTADFTHIQSFDPQQGHLVTYQRAKPVVMSTPGGRYAMGVYAPPGQDHDRPLQYMTWTFHMPTVTDSTNKWSVVMRKNSSSFLSTDSELPPIMSQPAAHRHVLAYDVYACIGTVDDVVECLMTLMTPGGDEGLIG